MIASFLATALRGIPLGSILLPFLAVTSLFGQAQYAGTYVGTINTRVSAGGVTVESSLGAYNATVTAAGAIDLSGGKLTGTVDAAGQVTFTGGSQFALLGLTSASIANNQLSSEYGALVANGTSRYRLNASSSFTGASGGGGGTGTTSGWRNGSFEAGPNPGGAWITLAAGAAQVPGWSVVSGTIDYMGTAWSASHGQRSIDLNGLAAGEIAQTFTTTPGTAYTVTFDFAGNPGYGNGTGAKRMRVSVDNSAATAEEFEFDTTGHSLAELGWVERSFSFTASAATTTLTFRSLSDSVYGPVLDNVRLNGDVGPADPTATTGGSDSTTVLGGSAPVAPANLTHYRNKVNQTFEFTVTGAASGSVWGTDLYTDDSSVARAAVHAGVVEVGETKVVRVTILPGQGSYSASTRHGVTTRSWGSWVGSYSFGDASGASGTATSAPQLSVATSTVDLPRNVAFGTPLMLTVPITGVGPFTYQWYLNGVPISGATEATYSIPTVTLIDAGTYSVRVSNAAGASTFSLGTVAVSGIAVGVPQINLQPFNKVVAPGGTFALATSASGANLSYQWYRDGAALSGETGPVMLRTNVNSGDAGQYTVRVSNTAGSILSNPATVTLDAAAPVLSNISVRADASGSQVVTPGFVLRGSGQKRVLIRAVGPGLAPFGVSGAMPNPKFTVHRIDASGTATVVGSNDDWSAQTGAYFAAVGAFGLDANSTDAAGIFELDANYSYTIDATAADGAGGVLLIEVYDAGNVSGASKLVNVSVRTHAGTGAGTLILGFALSGTGQQTLLVRGVGPSLAEFGVPGVLIDPNVQIVDANSRTLLSNGDWQMAEYLSELVLASNFVGAFALTDQSKDAGTLAILQAGSTYTVHVTGSNDGTGEALAEVYEVP